VADLLIRTPGVSLSRNGGIGSSTSVRIRGAETDQTVAVIDGVKLNDPSGVGGGFNFGNLLVGDVARIEVLRGAQSTLWGSQAIGGVVNIVSAQPTRPFQAGLNAEAGSRGTRYLRGGVGGATERATWRLAASHYHSDGFSTFARGTEDDGYENFGLSGRANIRIFEGVSADLRAVYSRGDVDFDGFPAPTFAFGDTRETGTTRDLVTYAGLNFDLFDGRLSNRVAYGFTRPQRQSLSMPKAGTIAMSIRASLMSAKAGPPPLAPSTRIRLSALPRHRPLCPIPHARVPRSASTASMRSCRPKSSMVSP
jgi:vitamin B12 transporter